MCYPEIASVAIMNEFPGMSKSQQLATPVTSIHAAWKMEPQNKTKNAQLLISVTVLST